MSVVKEIHPTLPVEQPLVPDQSSSLVSPRSPPPTSSLSITFHDLVVSTAPTLTILQRIQTDIAAKFKSHQPPAAAAPPAAANRSPPPNTKFILHHVSGYIPPHSLTAVMGGSGQRCSNRNSINFVHRPVTCSFCDSCLLPCFCCSRQPALLPPCLGAGKTTLLNFIAHRLAGCGAAHQSTAGSESVAADSAPNSNLDSSGAYHVAGSIHVNGHEVSSKFFSKVCAYVPQQSILLSSLTPRESIKFASKLRLPTETTEEQHEANTERVLTALSLHSCSNTRIGDELIGGGLSGGEKRRVNIGVELVTNPPLLCLDEPTTGLDSLTALNVLKSLKLLTKPAQPSSSLKQKRHQPHQRSLSQPGSPDANIKQLAVSEEEEQKSMIEASPSLSSTSANGGVTVVCSLHQPSSEMFDLIDQFILLSQGRILFCGTPQKAIKHFSRLNFPCPPLENPPEYFLDLIVCNPNLLEMFEGEYKRYFEEKYLPLHERQVKKKIVQLDSSLKLPGVTPQTVHSYPAFESVAAADSKSFRDGQSQIEGQKNVDESETSILGTPKPTNLRSRIHHRWVEFTYLTHRTYLNSSRLPLLKGAQILQTVVLGLLVGLAFLNLGSDQISVQNRLGAVYFINICVIFANTLSVVLTFSEERALFLREQGNQMYPVWSYFLSRISIEVLPTFLSSLGLSLICFWMMDSAASIDQFGRFLLLVVLLAYAGQGIGLIVSCGIASRMLAMIITPLAIAPFILFTPYAVDVDSIPYYFRPFQVGSPFWWGFTGLMLNMFTGLQFHCTSDQTISIPLDDGSFYLLCPYTSGVSVLERFNIFSTSSFGEDYYWVCCGLLVLLCVIYRILALIMLYKLALDIKDATK